MFANRSLHKRFPALAILTFLLARCVTLTDKNEAVVGTPGVTCTPALPEGFTPIWKPPRAPISVCTEGQVQDYYDSCRATRATPFSCEMFLSRIQNTTCIQCLLTSASRATFGAIIRWSDGSVSANVGGCIALTEGDLSDSGCGAHVLAKYECEDAACAACTPDTEQLQAAFERCKVDSDATVCRTYTIGAECAAKHPQNDRCFFGDDFRSDFLGVGAFFCANREAGASKEGGAADAPVD